MAVTARISLMMVQLWECMVQPPMKQTTAMPHMKQTTIEASSNCP